MSLRAARNYRRVQRLVEELAGKIEAPADLLPTYRFSEDLARPHIEIDGDMMHYVIVERGRELERRTTTDRDLLLFWVFESVTHTMAGSYELANRVEGQDFRIILFVHQAALLRALNADWVARWAHAKRQRLDEVGITDAEIGL